MEKHLEEIDKASGHTASTFCDRIAGDWDTLHMLWPTRRPQGEAMEELFQGLRTDLLKIRARQGLAQEMLRMRIEARLVSSVCGYYCCVRK